MGERPAGIPKEMAGLLPLPPDLTPTISSAPPRLTALILMETRLGPIGATCDETWRRKGRATSMDRRPRYAQLRPTPPLPEPELAWTSVESETVRVVAVAGRSPFAALPVFARLCPAAACRLAAQLPRADRRHAGGHAPPRPAPPLS